MGMLSVAEKISLPPNYTLVRWISFILELRIVVIIEER